MQELIETLGAWGVPAAVLGVIIGIFVVMQVTGEIIEWTGKVSPKILKVRKIFKENKEKKEKTQKILDQYDEQAKLLQSMQTLIADFNSHYSSDNMEQRNTWIKTVNDNLEWTRKRANIYDETVKQLTAMQSDVAKLSEFSCKIIKEDYRNRILDFQHRLVNARGKSTPEYCSREEFRKIYATYEDYEAFLEYTHDENHQVDDAMKTIRKAEAGELPNIVFIDDLRN